MSQAMFDDLVGKSFVHSKGDKQWETIRKASAHAFYKERLQKMMLVLKEKVEKWIDKRNGEIEASTDKKSIVDIAKSFEKLFCRNIVHICFGEDVSDMPVEIDFRNGPNNSEFLRKSVTLAEAIHEFEGGLGTVIGSKWLNPIY